MSQNDSNGMQESGTTHRMSIALVIGGTIFLIGFILLLYGLLGNGDYKPSDSLNINLWWGLAMVIFGLLMAAGSYFSTRLKAS